MTALEFGLPSLLLAGDPSPSHTATQSLSETAIGDAFVPTGLLLEEPTIPQETDGGESSRDQGGEFGGTCFYHPLDGGWCGMHYGGFIPCAPASQKNRGHANCFILLPCLVSPKVCSLN